MLKLAAGAGAILFLWAFTGACLGLAYGSAVTVASWLTS